MANGGGTEGLLYIYGAVIIAGLFTFFIAPYFAKLIRFFPPVVTGTVITIIGIALLPVAALDAVGGGANPDPTSSKNLAYAMGTLAIIVIIQRVFKGFMATVAVLAGLVIGTGVAFFLGDATFDSVGTSPWFEVTTPFFFGIPKFSAAAIISMIVVMLITAVETTGDVFATGEIVEKRVGGEDVSRALRADGLSTFIGGVLNSFPYTCFAENVGLVRLTRVKSRYVVAAAGVFMILIGLIPKAGALVASVPPPVLGGAALAMFATVAVVGIQTLARVDFHDHRNVVIVGTSLGLAMFVTAQPEVAKAVPDWAQIIFGSGITLGSLCAIFLNLIFHHVGKNFGPAVAGTPGTGVIRLDQVNEMTREDVRADLRPAVPGTDVGRRTGLRPAAVQGHPRPADGVPGIAVLRRTHRAAGPAVLLPGPGQRRRRGRYPRRGIGQGPGPRRPHHAERRGPRGVRPPHRGLPRPVRHPADRLGAGRGEPQSDPDVGLGAHAERADPGIRGRRHRGGQDRQPPVRRPGGRCQPDPRRQGGQNTAAAADPLSSAPAPSGDADEQTAGLQRFNAMTDSEATATLATCLDVPRWVEDVAVGRPYATAPEVLHRARASAASFTDAEIDAALARHPRIGEQAGADHDAEFSSGNRPPSATPTPTVTAAIRAGNAEYENRFDRVFVIRAAGRPATEILAELRRRLNNTPEAEKAEVVTQLREIALTRLETVLA